MAAYRIPSDVIVEILVYLPVRSLLRFKSVCKYWRTLIDSPLFIQFHLNKSLVSNFRHNRTLFYANDDSLCVVDDIYRPSKPIKVYWPKDIIRIRNGEYQVRAVGSCNGLVCVCLCISNDRFSVFYDLNVLCFLICNPSTRTFKFKPILPFSEFKCLESEDLSCWFGYDGEHDDYKIVVTRTYLKEKEGNGDVYIYSFKADSWKWITHTPVEGLTPSNRFIHVDKRAVCANNMLHYIVSSIVDDYNNDTNDRIARFDLSSETWKDDLSFPHVVKVWTYMELGVLDDCLYLCLAEKRSPHHNVWVMKGYKDGDYSWSIIKYNIPGYSHNLTLFAPLKEGPLRLLFVYEDSDYGINDDYTTHRVLWYNPDDATTETFKVKLEQSSSKFLPRLCITSSLVTIPGSSLDYIERPGNNSDENKNHELSFWENYTWFL